MFLPFIEISVSKASSDSEVADLRLVFEAASALDDEERTFGARIDANKEARGGRPTKLTKRKRAEIDSYSSDAIESEAQQLNEFSGFERAATIVSCLAPGLEMDIKFWEGSYKYAHPSDVPIVRRFVARKVALYDAMRKYLSVHSRADS